MNKIESLLSYTRKTHVLIIVLFLFSLIPYINIFQNEFVYDDASYFITWSGIKNFDMRAYFLGDHPINFHHVYRPVLSIIKGLVYKLTQTNPLGYHIFSVIAHFFNVILVYLISKKLVNHVAGLFTAIFFAVLPVHVMSVTFMTASFNTAGIIFVLLSFYLYLLFRERNDIKYFYFSFITAIVAYFSYEAALTLPFFIILYELCFRGGDMKNIVSKIKYVFWYIFGGAIFFFVRQSILKGIYTEPFLYPIDFISRILTFCKAFMVYMYLVIVNYPLDLYHPMEVSRTLDTEVIFSIFIILALLYIGYVFWKKGKKLYAFLIFWFFIAMFPYSNIIQLASFVDEQYLYMASFSWTLFLGYTFANFFMRYQNNQKKSHVALGALVIIILTYGSMTYARNFDWKDSEALWTKTITRHPDFSKSYTQLAEYYEKEGNLSKAMELLETIIEKQPNYSLTYLTLGDIYVKEKRYTDAVEQYKKAIDLRPNYAPAHHNLGYAYMRVGEIDLAVKSFIRAQEISPVFFDSIYNLAVIYLESGEFSKAKEYFEKASQLQKNNYEVIFGIGMSYYGQGNTIKAREYFEKTLAIKPDFFPARDMLKKIP